MSVCEVDSTMVPLHGLVAELGSGRNAIYTMLFDARRKLRAALVAVGFLGRGAAALMSGWSALDDFLRTDPRDMGCAQAMEMLYTCVNLVAA